MLKRDHLSTVRAEPVEALHFSSSEEVQPFDKLRASGGEVARYPSPHTRIGIST